MKVLTVPGRCARRHVYNHGRTEGILPLVLFPCELWIRCLGLNYKSHTRDLGAGLENETFGRRTNIETNPLIWRPFYILTICVPKIFIMTTSNEKMTFVFYFPIFTNLKNDISREKTLLWKGAKSLKRFLALDPHSWDFVRIKETLTLNCNNADNL